ncbi:hypothetical protein G7Y79_00033g068860 [Physcia stellaris]|nr:hypothetical protein G7Y79_00033g068860 [Physcia stellaris]
MAELRGMRSRRPRKPQLGESWVVESDLDGEYEPSTSDSGEDAPTLPRNNSHLFQSKVTPSKNEPEDGANVLPGSRRKSLGRVETPRTRAAHKTSKATTEPEFIMPSIHNAHPNVAWTGDKKLRSKETPQRASNRRANFARSTRGEQNGKDSVAYDWLEDIFGTILLVLRPILRWTYDVAGTTFNTLKTPIALLIAVYILLGMSVFLRNFLTSSIYSALSPVCRIPGSSILNLPMCKSTLPAEYEGQEAPSVHFDELMTVQSKFEEVLEASAGGVSLPLDMKRGETSIRDLRTVVRHSSLHSKNELVYEFDGFIETARIASWDLQKFNSHVGHSVDKVLATARWTRRVLEDISIRDASQGAISAFVNGKIFAPFQPLQFTESALVDQYIQHSRTVENEISMLVQEAQALLSVLLNMEDRLDLIHDIAVRDNVKAQGSKEEVLSELWTLLGGNSKKLGKLDSQLKLLKQVNTYRQSALAHVSGTLVKLQAMSHDLEDLRERMGGVEMVSLSVHIENIELGVERLEQGRAKARELESEVMRRTLDTNGHARAIEGRQA